MVTGTGCVSESSVHCGQFWDVDTQHCLVSNESNIFLTQDRIAPCALAGRSSALLHPRFQCLGLVAGEQQQPSVPLPCPLEGPSGTDESCLPRILSAPRVPSQRCLVFICILGDLTCRRFGTESTLRLWPAFVTQPCQSAGTPALTWPCLLGRWRSYK